MSLTAVAIDAFVVVCLGISLVKNREKTRTALLIAWNALKRLAPSVLAVIAVIGLIVGFIPPKWIASSIGGESGILGVVIAAFVMGLVTFGLGLLNVPGIVMSIFIGLLLIITIALPIIARRIKHARNA